MRFLPIIFFLSLIAGQRAAAQADFSLAPVTKVSPGELAEKFASPPGEAGMSCYWWWLNGVATEASITRDLEEMKAKGYGSASLIDAGDSTR